ncbi:Glycosyltransferase Family 4 [Tenacibaculum sp. 190524A02b]|uniref:Glycosyltransferase Family 4 n=1 Tax=Tenacibaculum vairaonense TaxID=3137860 RepID=A0ABM9PJC7_9FLAO
MIKILHIARPVGGVGVYIQLLSKFLENEKFSNILICNKKEKIIPIKNNLGEDIEKYHVNLKREINPFKDLQCLKEIIRIVKDKKPDVIHCHSAKSGILGRLAGAYLGVPTLYTPHAYSYLSTDSIVKRNIYMLIEKVFKFLPSKTLCCSKSEEYRTIYDLGFDTKKVLLWNNCIEDISHKVSNTFDCKLPKNYICTIGRPSYQKNTELLINTLFEIKKEKKDIHLVILGVGLYSPSLDAVKKLIEQKSLNDNVTLIEWIDREDALDILKKSNLYISTSRYEGLPYAVIEALALGKPCIVTDVDGNKDLVENEFNGFIVKENVQEIAKQTMILIEDENKMKIMGNNSYLLFQEKFSIIQNIELLEKIYTKIKKS